MIALGDMVRVRGADGHAVTYPGVAPVAIQQGRYAAKLVTHRLRGQTPAPFHYVDKGNIATIGRARAVAQIKFLKLSGFPAWLVWLGVHLWYLIGFQNRLLVLIKWSVSFLTHGRSARIISRSPGDDRPADGGGGAGEPAVGTASAAEAGLTRARALAPPLRPQDAQCVATGDLLRHVRAVARPQSPLQVGHPPLALQAGERGLDVAVEV